MEMGVAVTVGFVLGRSFPPQDEKAPQTAHELPEVMAVWEPMGELIEDKEFLDLETLG